MERRVNLTIKMFNFWYFFWIVLSILMYLGLYFLLNNRNDKTKKWVVFGVLVFWLIFPVYILITPLTFGIMMLSDRSNFINYFQNIKEKINNFFLNKKKNLSTNED